MSTDHLVLLELERNTKAVQENTKVLQEIHKMLFRSSYFAPALIQPERPRIVKPAPRYVGPG